MTYLSRKSPRHPRLGIFKDTGHTRTKRASAFEHCRDPNHLTSLRRVKSKLGFRHDCMATGFNCSLIALGFERGHRVPVGQSCLKGSAVQFAPVWSSRVVTGSDALTVVSATPSRGSTRATADHERSSCTGVQLVDGELELLAVRATNFECCLRRISVACVTLA